MSRVIMTQKVDVAEIPIPAGRPRAILREWVVSDNCDIKVFVMYSNGDIAKFSVNLTGEVLVFLGATTYKKRVCH